MRLGPGRRWFRVCVAASGLVGSVFAAAGEEIRYVDQGPAWTTAARALFYAQDQGSQLVPLAWLSALRQANGSPFLEDALARYGYLPNPASRTNANLPVGFSLEQSAQGPIVGMTCAACHVREIAVDRQRYRIDGGPAIADFAGLVADLDDAMRRTLADDASFKTFADAVLRQRASDPEAIKTLRADADLWSTRYHAIMSRSLPSERRWGPARLDAISMIYNRLAGLDLGPGPTHLIPENIQKADAPARYPFLWNSARQDASQWSGFAENGNDFLALARNLGQLYGVFGRFHPGPATDPASSLNRNYLVENSANFGGLATLEELLKLIGPPAWPWSIDHALAKRGEAIFNRPVTDGGCAACHAMEKGAMRPPESATLRTLVLDVGTDTRQWQILLRSVETGSMEGASIPGIHALQKRDLALNLLKVSVVGSIVEVQTALARAKAQAMPLDPKMGHMMTPPSHAQMDGAMKLTMKPAAAGPSVPVTNVYEARVLQGIWAAAPYLHNGSVSSLAELLKPASQRATAFKVGPAYDTATVGLATDQSVFDFTLHTTDCSDRGSGDSRCGHEYGTRLPADDKKALLEYLKTL